MPIAVRSAPHLAAYTRFLLTRPHPLSNMFVMRGERSREAAVAAFAYAWDHPEEPLAQVAIRPEGGARRVALTAAPHSAGVRAAAFAGVVAAARDGPVALFCVCAPKLCHCDVVRERVLRACSTAPAEAAAGSAAAAAPRANRRRKRSRLGASAPDLRAVPGASGDRGTSP